MSRLIKEGEGWRLGWNPDADVFQGLVGGDRWAVEMTQAEFGDFCRLTLALANLVQAIKIELMDEEHIEIEQETSHIWLEVTGLPTSYSLHFILLTGRQAEGEWTPAQTQALIQAIPGLKLF
jgi:hypothetical protein